MTAPEVYLLPQNNEETSWFRDATRTRLEQIRAWLKGQPPGLYIVRLTGPLETVDRPATDCDRCGGAAAVEHMEPHLTTTGHQVALSAGFCLDCARREGWLK